MNFKFGDEVTYTSHNKKEYGKVKSISDDAHVFVVYNCGGEWDHFEDYTAARTEIKDLTIGWPPEIVAEREPDVSL